VPSAAPATLKIDWVAGHPRSLSAVASIQAANEVGGVRILVAQADYTQDGGRVWWSEDGEVWHAVDDLKGEFFDLAGSFDRLFLAGSEQGRAAMWTSTDGRTWTSIGDPSFSEGAITRVVATASGLVAFGRRGPEGSGGIWISSDGVEWLAATNPSGNDVASGLRAVGGYEGRAVAVVSADDGVATSIWETTGRAEWTQVATLRSTPSIARIAGGPRGWVAIGDGVAWHSADGRSWTRATSGPDVAADLIADDAGFVAVGWIGSLPGETCGDQRPFAGHTWTSSDGRTWQRMPVTKEFKAAMVAKLLLDGRTLVGFGNRTDGGFDDRLPVQTWSASLPAVSRPAGASDKATRFQACGG
jgi:hypothetical protein